MDKRSDRGEFYPGGERGGVPPGTQPSEKVDRVNVGEIGESYTLKTVKEKVNQLVRVVAPAATCIAIIAVVRLLSPSTHAATAPLEDIPNTAHVVTNEEDCVAMAALATATNALQSSTSAAMIELRSDMATATNTLTAAMAGALEAESNRVESTYAKRSEIPTAPDLSPYALKSELPADYLREGDITNFATRAWISAQGYATGAETGARLDAQDLAIGAATNAQNAAIAATSNALATAHAVDMAKIGAATNALKAAMSELSSDMAGTIRNATNAMGRAQAADIAALKRGTNTLATTLRQATNALAIAHAADIAALKSGTNTLATTLRQATNAMAIAQAADIAALCAGTNALAAAMSELSMDTMNRINALEITGGNTRLWTSDARMFQDATGVVWQVQVVTGPWSVVHSWTTNGVDFGWTGPYWWGPAEGVDNDYYEGPGWYISSSSLTQWRRSEDPYESQIVLEWEFYGEEVHAVTTTCSRTVQWLTNAVNRVAYTNDLGAAKEDMERAMEDIEGRLTMNIEALRGQAAEIGTAATNYTEAVAAEFENGTRQVESAQYAGSSSDAMFAYKVSGDNWNDQYNANDLMRASTNAARAVVAPVAAAATNYTDAATNALAQTIPQGGGMPEWSVVTEIYNVPFVTNGMLAVTFPDDASVYAITNGWPDGASMFVRATVEGAYYPNPYPDAGAVIKLVGYGMWPTNNFQSVWWRSGTNIYVNVILEER